LHSGWRRSSGRGLLRAGLGDGWSIVIRVPPSRFSGLRRRWIFFRWGKILRDIDCFAGIGRRGFVDPVYIPRICRSPVQGTEIRSADPAHAHELDMLRRLLIVEEHTDFLRYPVATGHAGGYSRCDDRDRQCDEGCLHGDSEYFRQRQEPLRMDVEASE
jgi:hypothetical protein